MEIKKHIYVFTKFESFEKETLNKSLKASFEVFFHDEILENMQFQIFSKCTICFGNVPLSWLENNLTLQWLQLHSAGIDPYNQLKNAPFQITNLRGFFAESVAETTLASIMAFYRGIDKLCNLKSKKNWIGTPLRANLMTLKNNKVWILGNGSIALRLNELLAPFHCVVHVSTISELKANIHSASFFEEKAKNADLVIFVLPEIPETTHYLNKEKIKLVSQKTVIVNVGRGSSIDENELINALKNKKISGAILDVTEVEPLPAESPLWDMENVMLTQHTAGGWRDENIGKVHFFLENLKRFTQGEKLINIIDIAKGY